MKLSRLMLLFLATATVLPQVTNAQTEVGPYLQVSFGATAATHRVFSNNHLFQGDAVLGIRTASKGRFNFLAGVYGGAATVLAHSEDELVHPDVLRSDVVSGSGGPSDPSARFAGMLVGAEAHYKRFALSVTTGPGAFSLKGGFDGVARAGDIEILYQSTDAVLLGLQSRVDGIVSLGARVGIVVSAHSTVMQKYRTDNIRLSGFGVGMRVY